MLLEILIGLGFILLVWKCYCRLSRIRRLGDKIPGPPALPLIGNAFNFRLIGREMLTDLKSCLKNYGPTYRVWLGPYLNVLISDPADVQILLSSTKHIKKSLPYELGKSWLGTGLLVSTGDLWHRRRKAITPTFHFKILNDLVPVFNKCGNCLVECFKENVDRGSFDLTKYITNCALDTICESAMGTSINAQKNPDSDYVTSIGSYLKLLAEKTNYPWLAYEPFYSLSGRRKEESKHVSILNSLPKKVIREKSIKIIGDDSKFKENEIGIKGKSAFLEYLLTLKINKHEAFTTEKDVLDEVNTFMFEGHDTTTCSLSFIFWALGRYSDMQEKVYEEVSSLLGDREATMEDLNQMKYLERFIKEALRLYPPVYVIGRGLEEDVTLPSSGILVPAGADVYIDFYNIHRNPVLYKEPEKFDPDRFLPENIAERHPYGYLPFSAGPRNCIGQKFALLDLKAIVCKAVLNYKITSEEDVIENPVVLLRAKDGPKISLSLRLNQTWTSL